MCNIVTLDFVVVETLLHVNFMCGVLGILVELKKLEGLALSVQDFTDATPLNPADPVRELANAVNMHPALITIRKLLTNELDTLLLFNDNARIKRLHWDVLDLPDDDVVNAVKARVFPGLHKLTISSSGTEEYNHANLDIVADPAFLPHLKKLSLNYIKNGAKLLPLLQQRPDLMHGHRLAFEVSHDDHVDIVKLSRTLVGTGPKYDLIYMDLCKNGMVSNRSVKQFLEPFFTIDAAVSPTRYIDIFVSGQVVRRFETILQDLRTKYMNKNYPNIHVFSDEKLPFYSWYM